MSCAEAVKKSLILILIAVMISASFTSCGTIAENSSVTDAGTIVEETEDSITVIDQAGRKVTVTRNPESIALCYRVIIRFLLSLNVGDRITGIGKTEDFLEEVQPSLKDCSDVGKGVADIEALAELNPDLFIHKASDVETLEAVEKIGIPAVGIDVETPEGMMTALRILGIVCGEQERAEQLITYYEGEIERFESLTAGIKDRKTAIVMGSSVGKVADGSMLQGRMLTLAGADNCAVEIEATELWPTVGTEQIFQWNPEYIFITGGDATDYDAEDILNNPAWSEVKAVKNGHVYVIPAEKDSWEFPGVVSLLGIDFMMSTMYPDIMSEDELDNRVDELYELMYGEKFEKDWLGYQ